MNGAGCIAASNGGDECLACSHSEVKSLGKCGLSCSPDKFLSLG